MKRETIDFSERRSLREILTSPTAKMILRILGWILAGLAAAYLITLAAVVIFQPADRAFTRREEWIAIGLLALPALIIIGIAAARLLIRRKHRRSGED